MRRPSTLLLLLLLVGTLAACTTSRRGGGGGGGDDDDGNGPGGGRECDRLLECVASADPEDHADLYAQYGPDGTCWEAGEDAVAICNAACDDHLAQYDDSFEDPACRARVWPYDGVSEAGEGWNPGQVAGDIIGIDQYGEEFDVDWLDGAWVFVVFANNSSYWLNSATAEQASDIQAEFDAQLDEEFWVVLAPFGFPDAADLVAEQHDLSDLPVVQDDSLADGFDPEDLDTFPGPFLVIEPNRTVHARLTIDDLKGGGPDEAAMIRAWLDDVLP